MLLSRLNTYWESNSLEYQVEHVENGSVDFTVFFLRNDLIFFALKNNMLIYRSIKYSNLV